MELPEISGLQELREQEQACTRCPLYRDATQAVPGEGPAQATLMLVGEQPGHSEDVAGRPFVEPAGGMLDEALREAGVDRGQVYLTNAVKHFKHEPRGKRRLHKRPNAYEIDRCRWWMALELRLVRPDLVVALGATAARGLLGRTVTVSRVRGKLLDLDDETKLLVTTHPSALLRVRDREERARRYGAFVQDLVRAAGAVAAGGGSGR